MRNFYSAILLLFVLILASCSSTKYIGNDQAVVKKLAIKGVDKQFEEQAYGYVQKDLRPGSLINFNVGLYNLFNTKNGRYKTTKIRNIGSPPSLLDSGLVEISRVQIEKFLKTKGYFTAKVKSNISVKNKLADVVFTAEPGTPFIVQKIVTVIPDAQVQSLFNNHKHDLTRLDTGMRYDADSLTIERERIYRLMKENGYFDFYRQYVRFDVDSNHRGRANVKLFIDNPVGKNSHEKFAYGKSNIIVKSIYQRKGNIPDTTTLKDGTKFADYSHRFKPAIIKRYMFLDEGQTYDTSRVDRTYERLYQLNAFKNIRINYKKSPDSTLKVIDPVIELIPQKRMTNRIEGEIPFNAGIIGFDISNTFSNRNLFGGAEKLEVKIKGGLRSQIGEGNRFLSNIYQRDFSLSTSISFPKLLVPFWSNLIGKNGMPRTIFSASYMYNEQKDFLSRRNIITSVTYEWNETKSKVHSLTPLNLEYRYGTLNGDSPAFMNLDPQTQLFYRVQFARKEFSLGTIYTYTLNEDKLFYNRAGFIYFRGSLDVAGNSLYLIKRLSGAKPDPTDNPARILNVPFNQYIRPDIDVRYYKNFSGDRQFVVRLNAGVGYAYGNSNFLPFEKQFIAGGSNSIRAWQARTLGPGNYNRSSLPSDTVRRAVFGLDQLGDMRIMANAEYRFKIIDKFFGAKLKGAVFVDAGNTWNLRDNGINGKVGVFDIKKFSDQIAIGTGAGLRFDLSYFVFRFDVGLKIKDPQFEGSDQWVIGKYINGGKAFKDRYAITNGPDVYRFLQYNFGIGMPF